ncbi:MAG: hypothetical protein AB8B66_05840 [Rickettsiaceae bacterium]
MTSNTSTAENSDYTSLDNNKRIGVVALFPEPLGMFYNNRAKLFRRGRTTSLFPNKNIKLSRNLNKDIIQNTTHNLAASVYIL